MIFVSTLTNCSAKFTGNFHLIERFILLKRIRETNKTNAEKNAHKSQILKDNLHKMTKAGHPILSREAY